MLFREVMGKEYFKKEREINRVKCAKRSKVIKTEKWLLASVSGQKGLGSLEHWFVCRLQWIKDVWTAISQRIFMKRRVSLKRDKKLHRAMGLCFGICKLEET